MGQTFQSASTHFWHLSSNLEIAPTGVLCWRLETLLRGRNPRHDSLKIPGAHRVRSGLAWPRGRRSLRACLVPWLWRYRFPTGAVGVRAPCPQATGPPNGLERQ